MSTLSPAISNTRFKMKRKRSFDSPLPSVCPKTARQCRSQSQRATNTHQSCPLLHVLEQYGLLVSIVSNFVPEDLFSLAATSKATYRAIFSGNSSIINLLGHMPCAGRGVVLRQAIHQRSSASKGLKCINLDICGSQSSVPTVETRPCDTCSHTTCDECRVHCVFNSTIEPTEEQDELPIYSGFVLLDPADMGILTFAHLGYSDPITTTPYHDRGFLDGPWTSQQATYPEDISEIIDFPIGSSPLQLVNNSNARHPSCVIKAFWDYTEGMLCKA